MTIRELSSLIGNIRFAVFDFDGVFTNNQVIVSENGKESVICCRSDGLGLRRLEEAGVQTLILSAEPTSTVAHRARKLRIECQYGVKDKLGVLRKEAKRRGIPLAATAFVGNDINDAECLRVVGLPVVVADAWPEVVPLAKWMLKRRGGEGAVREFCDEVWKRKSKT